MEEQVITTKNGRKFGRVQVTLPMHVKNTLLELQNYSGMKRAEFLRQIIFLGMETYSRSFLASSRAYENYYHEYVAKREHEQQTARR